MFKVIIEKLKITYHLWRTGEYAVFFLHSHYNPDEVSEKFKKNNCACYTSYGVTPIFLDTVSEYSKILKKGPYDIEGGKYKIKTDITGQRCMKCSLRFKCPFPPDIRICSKYGLTEDKYFKEVKNGK